MNFNISKLLHSNFCWWFYQLPIRRCLLQQFQNGVIQLSYHTHPCNHAFAVQKFRLWSDAGATSDSDGAPFVEPKLSSTDSVELNAFAAPN